MKNIIERLDIFGSHITLSFQGHNSVKTTFGGMLAIIALITIFCMTWFLGKDIILHEKPTIIVKNEVLNKRPSLTFDRNNFPIAIALQDDYNEVFYEDNYFIYQVEIVNTNNTNTDTTSISLELEQCTYAHFPMFNSTELDKAGIRKYQCIKDQNFTIFGYWDEESINYINIKISYCRGDDKCASIDEIDGFLEAKSFTWNIYFQNALVDSENFDKPISHFMQNKYKIISTYGHKSFEIYIEKQRVVTDSGYIFESVETQELYNYEYSELDSGPMTREWALFDINIYPTNKIVTHKRSYIKLQQILANLGGIIKLVLLLSKQINSLFANYKKNTCILNTLYDFDFSDINNKDNKTRGSLNINITQNVKSDNNNVNINEAVKESGLSAFKQIHSLDYNNSNRVLKDLTKNHPSISEEHKQLTNNNHFIIEETNQNQQNHNNDISRSKFKPQVYRLRVVKNVEEEFMNRVNLKKGKILHFSYLDILKISMCYCFQLKKELRIKQLLYRRSIRVVKDNFDILKMIKRFDEFEKLKFVLFNKDQLALFNYIGKMKCGLNEPIIHATNQINNLFEYVKNEKSMASAVIKFQSSTDRTLSTVDKKLLNLLDEDMKLIM